MEEIRDYAAIMAESIFEIQREHEKIRYETITPEFSEKIREDLKKQMEKFSPCIFEGKCVTCVDVYLLSADDFYAKIRNANAPMTSTETKEEAVAYVAEFLVKNLHIMLHVWEYGEPNAIDDGIERVQREISSRASEFPGAFCDEWFYGTPRFAWMKALKNSRPYSYYMIVEIIDVFRTSAYNKIGLDGSEYSPVHAMVWVLSHRDIVLPPYA